MVRGMHFITRPLLCSLLLPLVLSCFHTGEKALYFRNEKGREENWMKNTDRRSFCTPKKVKEKMGKRRSFGAFKAFDDINSLLDMHSNAS